MQDDQGKISGFWRPSGAPADLALLEDADALLGELTLDLLDDEELVRVRLDENEGGLETHCGGDTR